jgi:hypothetical protein
MASDSIMARPISRVTVTLPEDSGFRAMPSTADLEAEALADSTAEGGYCHSKTSCGCTRDKKLQCLSFHILHYLL